MHLDPVGQQPNSAASGTNFQQLRADFQSLTQALQSNDLSGAQKDFALVEADAPAIAQAVTSTTGPTGITALDNLKALAGALQSNDLTGAQSAMTSLQQSLAGAGSVYHRHHHHHHHGAGVPTPTSNPSTDPTAPASTAVAATNSGSLINAQG